MTNCDKGKAGTVHPECVGEQHYSDDHGTGSAIKEAKAPDVDLQKEADASLAGVKDSLEKAKTAMKPINPSFQNRQPEGTKPSQHEHNKDDGVLGYDRSKIAVGPDGNVLNDRKPSRKRIRTARNERRAAERRANGGLKPEKEVKDVYAEAEKNPMLVQVSSWLNQHGHKTPSGSRWNPETVRRYLDDSTGFYDSKFGEDRMAPVKEALKQAQDAYRETAGAQRDEDMKAIQEARTRSDAKARELMAVYGPNSPMVMNGTKTPMPEDSHDDIEGPGNTEYDIKWDAAKDISGVDEGWMDMWDEVYRRRNKGDADAYAYEKKYGKYRYAPEGQRKGVPTFGDWGSKKQDLSQSRAMKDTTAIEQDIKAKEKPLDNLISLEPGASKVGEFKDTTPERDMKTLGREMWAENNMRRARGRGAGSANVALGNDPNKDPTQDLQTGRTYDGKGATPPSVRELNAQAKGLAQNKQEEPEMEQDKQASVGKAEIKDNMSKGEASPVASIRDLMKAAEDEREFAYPSGFRPKGANFDGRIHPYQEMYRTVYMDRDMPAMPDMDRVKRVRN